MEQKTVRGKGRDAFLRRHRVTQCLYEPDGTVKGWKGSLLP